MTVYIVTQGFYEDGNIVAVFSDKEIATRYASQHSTRSVEEHSVDVITVMPAYMKYWLVQMDKEGSSYKCYHWDPGKDDHDFDRPVNKHGLAHNKRGYNFYVWAADEITAVKIADERRLLLLAANTWFESELDWLKNRRMIEDSEANPPEEGDHDPRFHS